MAISHEFAALTREILFLPLEHKIHRVISSIYFTKSTMSLGMVLLSSKLCHTFNTHIMLFSLFQVKNCLIMVYYDPLIVKFVFKSHFC